MGAGANPNRNRPSFGEARQEQVQIRRWGLSFDGDPKGMPVAEFIFRVEHLQTSYQVPWAEVLKAFHTLVSGHARDWYWMHVRTVGMPDWPNLRYGLQQQFQVRRTEFEREQELRERRQRHGESADQYIQEMLVLRSRLLNPFSDYDLIKIIKINIRDAISRVIYPMQIPNLQKLREECADAEKLLATRGTRSGPDHGGSRRREDQKVHELDANTHDPEEQTEALDAVHRTRESGGDRTQLKCWNCAQPGHTYFECESAVRNLFCYKCGLAGVILPKCPKCRPGNAKRSTTQLEESSSTSPRSSQ
ncbi:uncharacterized protein LOC117194090 [Drosophila miranda]|uniref:uncharacterized protein LOC117194090 n=1 Tax=Drosophila miranda TaxID=7229 RepID=UPI00143F1522|nr:uncharacterized protein LOC117194090 [Drosophila miranda]